MTTSSAPYDELSVKDLRYLGDIDGAEYVAAADGRELRLKGRNFHPEEEYLRPDQVAVRYVDREANRHRHRLAVVVEPGTYAEKVRRAEAAAERRRHPPLRVVDALADVSGMFRVTSGKHARQFLGRLTDRKRERLPIADLLRSLEAAGIHLEALHGKLLVRAPEGQLAPAHAELLTSCETLIAAHLEGTPVRCWLCDQADAITYAVPSLPVCAGCFAEERPSP